VIRRLELTRFSWLTTILKSRAFQPALMLLTLFFFIIAILTRPGVSAWVLLGMICLGVTMVFLWLYLG
jgi:hypothetical protein